MSATRTIGVPFPRARALRQAAVWRRVLTPEGLLVLAGLAFLALSVWWVAVDQRIADFDNAKHLTIALGYYDGISGGHPFGFFTDWNQYPPLVHLVGVAAYALAGPHPVAAVLAENLVFVPLLVAGCYGAGRVTFGRRAGVLAALFALGAPMVMALFHVFMLDAPEAALVAVTVWALLASDRFADVRVSALAGLAAAAGLYSKATFVLFVAGVVVTMLARGGWRNWRGLAAFCAIPLVLAAPWYIVHLHDLSAQTGGAVSGRGPLWYAGVSYPARWSLTNYVWYGWSFVNNQFYLPLTLFFLAGTALAARHWLRLRLAGRRHPAERELAARSHIPELLVGGLTSYLAISYLTLDDPRYSLPALVFVAVLATGWVTWLRGRRRRVAICALAAILALNVFMLNTGDLGDATIRFPNATHSPIGEWSLTVASNKGYIEGAPDPHGLRGYVTSLLERARRGGARNVIFQGESMNGAPFNMPALGLIARSANVHMLDPSQAPQLGPRDVFVYRASIAAVHQLGCLPLGDGTSLYVIRGTPTPQKGVTCPPGPVPRGPS